MRIVLSGLALCCILPLAGCGAVETLADTPLYQMPEDSVFSSLTQLHEHMGFHVKSLYTLPEGYVELGWECRDGTALTTYTCERTGGIIMLYMWEDALKSDPVFDTDSYTLELDCMIGNIPAVALGEGELVYFCRWREQPYNYALYLWDGVDPVIFRLVLDGIQ